MATGLNNGALNVDDPATTRSNLGIGGTTAATQTYEEGTWTPIVTFGGGSTGITYATQTGHYVRVGKLYFIRCSVVLTSKGSDVGNALITGLPAVPNSTTEFALRHGNITFAGNDLSAESSGSTSFYLINNVTAGAGTQLTDAAFANNTILFVSGCFRIA